MSRSGFLRSVYNFVSSTGVVAAGTIYLGKRYHEKHGHHHPVVQKFHNIIEPFAQDFFPSERVTKPGLSELPPLLPYYLVENRSDSSVHLKALLFACKLSGARLSDFVISILDDKMPIEDILWAIEDDKELAKCKVTLYDNPTTSSLNLAHIAAMSNRKLEEKARLIEFLQQKDVDIYAKDHVGETPHRMCPGLSMFKRPETAVGGSEHGNLQHESKKEDPYSRSI